MIKCTKVVLLLDTTVCNAALEFQGAAGTMTIVRHDGVVTRTGGPLRPTIRLGNAPGRREDSPGAVCRGSG